MSWGERQGEYLSKNGGNIFTILIKTSNDYKKYMEMT